MQVWVDRFGETPESANEPVPFLVTPPIFRMEPNEGQSIRLLYTREALPQDRWPMRRHPNGPRLN